MRNAANPAQRVGILGNQGFSIVNFRLPLMREIARQGHQVFAIAPDFDAETKASLTAEAITPVPISLSRTGFNPLRDLGDVVALARCLESLHLDTILSFAIKPVIYGTLAARWAGIPHRHALIAGLGYAFGASEERSPGRRFLRETARRLYWLSLSQADRVFMQNPDDIDDFLNMGIVQADKIVRVNGTGVDLDAWPALPAVEQPVTFILVARLLREKGVEDFAAAARLVKGSHPQARFLLLGGLDSNPGGLTRQDVEAWSNDGVLEWKGHVPVRPWLSQSSVFVLPSYYREGIPRSILEALSSGRPVITTDMPGCRETVLPGQNGWLVAPRDPSGLATAMLRFIGEPALLAPMGDRSRRLAEEKFDIRDVNARMINAMGLGAKPLRP